MARYDPTTGSSGKQTNDYNGDGNADVLARDASGVLWLYPSNGRDGWLTRVRVGGGWSRLSITLLRRVI